MTPDALHRCIGAAPARQPFTHWPDRESAWLLWLYLCQPQRIVELARGPHGHLLRRPGLRPAMAAAGDGWLRPELLRPFALPGDAQGSAMPGARRYGQTLESWGTDADLRPDTRQSSRDAPSLVLRLDLPLAEIVPLGSPLAGELPLLRRLLTVEGHPGAQNPSLLTVAWARMDFEPGGQELLIEEIQSDLPGRVAAVLDPLDERHAALGLRLSGAFRQLADGPLAPHLGHWPAAALLSALEFARQLGTVRRVYLHQPVAGMALKGIPKDGSAPPRSIYSHWPRRFGFAPTMAAPLFVESWRPAMLDHLRRRGAPVFWRFDMPGRGS